MTFDEDRELRARLRAADPAADLEPATPERMARLLEDTMDQNTHPSTRDEQATTRRSPLTWVAAAAAVAVLVGGGFWFTRGGDAPSPPVAASPTVSELEVPADAGAAKCMVPSADVLSTQTTAFDGVVTSLEDGIATLEVSRWYAGAETDQVRVSAPSEDLQALILAVDFEVGKRYLVAADGPRVAVCGFSAEYTPELAAMYDEAFGG